MSKAVKAVIGVCTDGGIQVANVYIDGSYKYQACSMYGQGRKSFVDEVLEQVYTDFDPREASVTHCDSPWQFAQQFSA